MDDTTKGVLSTFVKWTKLKVVIYLSDKEIYPKIREIWWVSIGQNIGVEINGKNENFERPVLVFKVFNRFSVLVLPISSVIKDDKYNIQFVNEDGEKNVIKMSQIKTVSTKRFLRKVGSLKQEDFQRVKESFKSFV